MNLKTTFLIPVCILSFQLSFGQQNHADSCEITIGTWFEPACYADTCTGPRNWGVSYSEACHIVKVVYKVYDPNKTKLIYKSNTIWDGKKSEPLQFYEAGYYPYEILFYTRDKKTIKKQGKVHLHVW